MGIDSVSVLSDEPCWGQSRLRPPAFAPCVVSVLSDEPCWGQFKLDRPLAELVFVSVLSDEPCWGQLMNNASSADNMNRFQCSPTSRVGVNGYSTDSTYTRLAFQCSPTSRVGVNSRGRRCTARRRTVSVLSDEPCWGQSRDAVFPSFEAALVSVLSDEPCWGQFLARLRRGRSGCWFQCSPTSRVGVNPGHGRPARR